MKIEKEIIYLISRNSNIKNNDLEDLLKDNIYNDKIDWINFLKLFFITMGIAFSSLGILFFLAYNWKDLHRFTKLGIVEVILLISILTIFIFKISRVTKNIILTGASFLVGVLFAVYGQIYQTADSYELFLAWSIAILIWVFITNFTPLNLLYIILLNTTFILYIIQMKILIFESPIIFFTSIFSLNLLFFTFFILLEKRKIKKEPTWFMSLLFFTILSLSTFTIIIKITDRVRNDYDLIFFIFLISVTVIIDFLMINYSLKSKNLFNITAILFSFIIIFTTLITTITSDTESMILTLFLFVIMSVTLLIQKLIKLHKEWSN